MRIKGTNFDKKVKKIEYYILMISFESYHKTPAAEQS